MSQMAEETACKTKVTGPDVNSQYVVNNGNLENVFVYVKSGLPAGATYAPDHRRTVGTGPRSAG